MAPVARGALTWPDYLVVAALLCALLLIGAAFTWEQRGTRDFFLARRRIPWWAACLSFLATEISAVTIIAVPATAYSENWHYVQFFVGASLAKVAVAWLFIPAFYRWDCTSIYEFLGHRFGTATQVAGALFFAATRLLGSGVRLMAACVAVSVLVGWPLPPVIVLFTAVSIAYIGLGGVKAVVWTGVLQAGTFLAAGVATLWFLASQVPGGLLGALRSAARAGRLEVVNWGPAPGDADFWPRVLGDPNIVWLALLSGFVGSVAAFGTDHDLMQRLLTVESRRASQRTLLLTPLGTLVTLLLYLGIGAGLYAYYAGQPAARLPRPDEILPFFAATAMPELLRGLLLAAIVLASIDSPLGALAASFVSDLYRPHLAPGRSERHYVAVSRAAVGAFGLALAALAFWFSFFSQFLWLAFKIASVTFGSLLGVFLLGLLTPLASNRANVAAMVVAAAVNVALLIASETGRLPLAWSWLVLLGTASTMAVAALLAPLLDRGAGGRRRIIEA
jgi:SSS family transporter